MSWTTPEVVKLHLQAFSVDALTVHFYPIFLKDGESIQLPNNTLVRESIRIYQNRLNFPSGPNLIVLYNTAWTNIGDEVLLPDSVVVSSDDLGRKRYQEGVDFVVDYASGNVKRLSGSNIESGETVYCWFLPLKKYTIDSDFEVDEVRGIVTRKPDGDIPETASLFASYSTSAAGATDALITQAITEAEAKIEARLNDDFTTESVDDRLTMGATELAIALICDDMAVRALTAVGDTSADDRSKRFMDLAKRFEERAISTLSPCLRHPLPTPSKTASPSGTGLNW